MRKVLAALTTAVLFSFLFVSPARAQTATTTFLVSITVTNSCTIAVNPLDFGTVSDLTPAIAASTTAR